MEHAFCSWHLGAPDSPSRPRHRDRDKANSVRGDTSHPAGQIQVESVAARFGRYRTNSCAQGSRDIRATSTGVLRSPSVNSGQPSSLLTRRFLNLRWSGRRLGRTCKRQVVGSIPTAGSRYVTELGCDPVFIEDRRCTCDDQHHVGVPGMNVMRPSPPPATPGTDRSRPGLLLAVISAAAFGVSGALGKGLLETGWSSGAVVIARNGIGAVLLAPVTIRTLRSTRLGRRQWGTIAIYGLLAVAGTQVFFFNAVERLSVGVALMVEYLAPFLLVGWAWSRTRVRPGARTLLGGAFALLGMGLVVDLLGSAEVDLIGLAWALAAAIGLAAFYYLSARPMEGVPSVALAGSGIAAGTVVLAALGLVGVLPMRASTADAVLLGSTRPWWLIVIALGVISCVVAYVTGILAASRLGERVASFVGLTEVLFAVLFAWLLLDELPGLAQLVGGILILTGLVLVQSDKPTPHEVVS